MPAPLYSSLDISNNLCSENTEILKFFQYLNECRCK